MNIFPLLTIGSPHKDRVFFNGGLAKIKDKLYCSARDGNRKYEGTHRVEVLTDASLFSLDIKNISSCREIEEIPELLHSNNYFYKKEGNLVYSEVERLKEEGVLISLPGSREEVCREDNRFIYLGKDRWAFIYNIWKHNMQKNFGNNSLSIINTATQIATGNPENMFSDVKFFDPLIEGEKIYGAGEGEWPYKSLIFGPIFIRDGEKVKATHKLAGRFRPMEAKGEYHIVEGEFKEKNFFFKDTGAMEGMNYIEEDENLHVSPSTNPLLLKITDIEGTVSWFNFYMDHRRKNGAYHGHFQITSLDNKRLLYFEKEPSLKPAEMINKTKYVKHITRPKLKGIEKVVVPYGLVSLNLSTEEVLLIACGVSDSFWLLSGLYSKDLIRKIEYEIEKYKEKCANRRLLDIFSRGILEIKFINYNDI